MGLECLFLNMSDICMYLSSFKADGMKFLGTACCNDNKALWFFFFGSKSV